MSDHRQLLGHCHVHVVALGGVEGAALEGAEGAAHKVHKIGVGDNWTPFEPHQASCKGSSCREPCWEVEMGVAVECQQKRYQMIRHGHDYKGDNT